MSLEGKRWVIIGVSVFFLAGLIIVAQIEAGKHRPDGRPAPVVPVASKKCYDCHMIETPGLTHQWEDSMHAIKGIGCYDCHKAQEGDVDAFEHEGQVISVIVSPKDCAQCHEREVDEFTHSHHAKGAQILGSLDNVLAEVVEGHATFRGDSPVAVQGCKQCHGSEVKVLEDGKLDPATWPNTGIGRINPDGSTGSCSACHSRHRFSVALARQPENCGKCHLGPDHPQYEIYEESKHGAAFHAHIDEMNLDAQPWVVGRDYTAAPTCATCHMSATSELPVTHDVGDRISWTLRPPVSEKVDAAALKQGKTVKSWEARRKDMMNVCVNCHAKPFVDGFYEQFDSVVNLYNDKFGIPATNIFKAMRAEKLITDIEFDEKIEWTYFYLWHHEGRRARHGASMMAPDYVQWHGFYEVAERFYMAFIPEAKEIIAESKRAGHNTEGIRRVEKLVNEVLASDMHRWSIGKMTPAEVEKRKAASKAFKARYAQ